MLDCVIFQSIYSSETIRFFKGINNNAVPREMIINKHIKSNKGPDPIVPLTIIDRKTEDIEIPLTM